MIKCVLLRHVTLYTMSLRQTRRKIFKIRYRRLRVYFARYRGASTVLKNISNISVGNANGIDWLRYYLPEYDRGFLWISGCNSGSPIDSAHSPKNCYDFSFVYFMQCSHPQLLLTLCVLLTYFSLINQWLDGTRRPELLLWSISIPISGFRPLEYVHAVEQHVHTSKDKIHAW